MDVCQRNFCVFLKIKTPAKINLTLDVLGVRPDGYHDIASIMQTVSLYDYLSFELSEAENLEIELSGTSSTIPYDERNLIYKAIKLVYRNVEGIKPYKIKVFLEKNIPSEAGMGGGSSNAAGTIWALNRLLDLNLTDSEINSLCAALGSDLNVCYWGGASLATSRGEVVKKINIKEYPLTVIKPIGLGISAKEGYQMFDSLNRTFVSNSTEKFLKAIEKEEDISSYLHNDLEILPVKKYSLLKEIKQMYPTSIMTGSGSACFVLGQEFDNKLSNTKYQVFTNLHFVSRGIDLA